MADPGIPLTQVLADEVVARLEGINGAAGGYTFTLGPGRVFDAMEALPQLEPPVATIYWHPYKGDPDKKGSNCYEVTLPFSIAAKCMLLTTIAGKRNAQARLLAADVRKSLPSLLSLTAPSQGAGHPTYPWKVDLYWRRTFLNAARVAGGLIHAQLDYEAVVYISIPNDTWQ